MQLSFGLTDHVNAILVDALSVDRLLLRIRENGYEPNTANDLYELIVQAVFRDRIWLAPANGTLHSINIMQPWLANGVAVQFKKRPPPRSNSRYYMAREPHFSRFVGTALHYDVPCLVPSDYRQPFQVLAAPLVENAICDAVAQHAAMTSVIQTAMLRQGLSRPHLVRLRIPPVPYEVIRQSRSISDVVDQALDVRHRYAELRRELSEVSAFIADGTRKPSQKVKEIRSLERSWSKLHQSAEGEFELQFSKVGGYLAQIGLSGAELIAGLQIGTSEISTGGVFGLAKIATALPGLMEANKAAWRLQPLSKSVRLNWETSDREMLVHIERVLGRPRFAPG